MTAEELSDLEAALGHGFRRRELLEQALTHASLRHEQQTGQADQAFEEAQDNERLEFLGDAVLGLVVAELLYRLYPELQEGELTRLRAALVSRQHLGQVGSALNLGVYLHLGKAEERSGGRKKSVLLANCVEALIAALYLEAGLSAAASFIERIVTGPYLHDLRAELASKAAIGDYKSALQELSQARRVGWPEYSVEAESGPDHRKRFLVQASILAAPAKRLLVSAQEKAAQKKAEQEAARKLYEQLIHARSERLGASLHRDPDGNPDENPLSGPSQQHPQQKNAAAPGDADAPWGGVAAAQTKGLAPNRPNRTTGAGHGSRAPLEPSRVPGHEEATVVACDSLPELASESRLTIDRDRTPGSPGTPRVLVEKGRL